MTDTAEHGDAPAPVGGVLARGDLPSVTRRPAGPPAGGHLAAVDVVRFLTVGGVILVHCTSLAVPKVSLVANGVLQLFHVTRSVFLLLSAFVLTYSFRRRPLGTRAFWKRRFPLVVVPYATWSAIYVATDGNLHHPWYVVVEHYLLDLVDGGAHFHLYFLLLTLQLYLIFPALMAALRRWPRSLVPALWASLAFELAFTAGIHYHWRPPVLGVWFTHAGSWLPSYTLYVVGGMAAAISFDRITAWIRGHYHLVALAFAASVVLGQVSYVVDLRYLHYAPITASAVFQPANVLEAVAATAGQYALGLWVADQVGTRRLRQLERSSDVSFGVYLAHPLLVGGILDLAALAGLSGLVGGIPSPALEVLVAFGLVPFAYAVAFFGIDRVRRTRVSLALTGRRGPRPAPVRT